MCMEARLYRNKAKTVTIATVNLNTLFSVILFLITSISMYTYLISRTSKLPIDDVKVSFAMVTVCVIFNKYPMTIL